VAQMAKGMGDTSAYNNFTKRAGYFQNMFDGQTRYMRPKDKEGHWLENFNPLSTGGYTEGNAWQYTFFVPHDVNKLVNLMGRDTFNNRLVFGFEQSAKMNFNAIGDKPEKVYINHGNQPNMQAAYLFNYSGKPWLTQHWVREIMNRFYGADPYNGWPGDEDEGQMGAWFVMSAMGLFETDGGTSTKPVYEIGSPLFNKITIQLDPKYYPGKTFVIEAKNGSDANRYIQSATLNGKPLNKPWFYHTELVRGGNLVLNMGATPNKNWGSQPGDAPPSMSTILP